ncbi:MAG: DMT family transporter [Alphaproteobacteria bacterium]|nr:DMT family transporter [Alphaproteobacteria bacterium]
MHPLEISFFRNFGSLLCMIPWILTAGIGALRTGNQKLYIGRSVIGFLANVCLIAGFAWLPLNDSTALSFTTPLFAAGAAAILLGETIGSRRLIAALAGFTGALIVLRPGLEELSLPQGLVLAGAALAGVNAAVIRQLAVRNESPNLIVTYMALYSLPLALVAAIPVWETPPWWAIPWLAVLAACATFGHLSLTRAFACMDATAVTALDFVRLPLVALAAWMAFGEEPDGWSWLGALVIVGASVYLARWERAAPQPTEPLAAGIAGATSGEGGTAAVPPVWPERTPAAVRKPE